MGTFMIDWKGRGWWIEQVCVFCTQVFFLFILFCQDDLFRQINSCSVFFFHWLFWLPCRSLIYNIDWHLYTLRQKKIWGRLVQTEKSMQRSDNFFFLKCSMDFKLYEQFNAAFKYQENVEYLWLIRCFRHVPCLISISIFITILQNHMMNNLKYFNVQWRNILFRWLRQFIIYSCMLYASALNHCIPWNHWYSLD